MSNITDRREIPRGATICIHSVEPYDCEICFPRPKLRRLEEPEDEFERRTR